LNEIHHAAAPDIARLWRARDSCAPQSRLTQGNLALDAMTASH
jgi:hypothetical protein